MNNVRARFAHIVILGSFLVMGTVLASNDVFAQESQQKPQRTNPKIDLIIGFKEKPGKEAEDLINGVGGNIKHTYNIIPAIAASVPDTAVKGLLHNPKISGFHYDAYVNAVDIELENGWGVNRIDSGVAHNNEFSGAGIKVAVIDSGIDPNHVDLTVVDGYDFVDLDTFPDDIYGHGTHVAGTICAHDNGFGVVGVSHECELYSLRVLNDKGSGKWSDIIAAMDWAVENNIQVANLSLGSSLDPGYLVKQAFDNAEKSGLLVVAAAGNSGHANAKGNNIIYPAKYSSVIAVTAVDKEDTRPAWSSTGTDAEIAAPGVSVVSTWNGATSTHDPQPVCISEACYYKYGSGTSMAAPHVAGVGALLWNGTVDENDNGRVNDEIRKKLQDSVIDLGKEGRDPIFGYGLINVAKALSLYEAPPPPEKNVEMGAKITNMIIQESKGKNKLEAIATVEVTRNNTDPAIVVESATVSGIWEIVFENRAPTQVSVTGTTNHEGLVELKSPGYKIDVGDQFRLTITDASKKDHIWDEWQDYEHLSVSENSN